MAEAAWLLAAVGTVQHSRSESEKEKRSADAAACAQSKLARDARKKKGLTEKSVSKRRVQTRTQLESERGSDREEDASKRGCGAENGSSCFCTAGGREEGGEAARPEL